MKKQNKGITLIVLVITIIVLLILVGITISLVMGKNGLIAKAQQAGKNYTQASDYESANLNELGNQIIAISRGDIAQEQYQALETRLQTLENEMLQLKSQNNENFVLLATTTSTKTPEKHEVQSINNFKSVMLLNYEGDAVCSSVILPVNQIKYTTSGAYSIKTSSYDGNNGSATSWAYCRITSDTEVYMYKYNTISTRVELYGIK